MLPGVRKGKFGRGRFLAHLVVSSKRLGSAKNRTFAEPATFGQNPLNPIQNCLMLSTHTLRFLDELFVKSHEAYSEGGMLWTFVEAANQGHFRFKDAHRALPASGMNLERLGYWLQCARSGQASDLQPVTAESIADATKLVAALKEDLQADDFLLAFDDAWTEMTANIYMIRNSDNRYFALEMWWSID